MVLCRSSIWRRTPCCFRFPRNNPRVHSLRLVVSMSTPNGHSQHNNIRCVLVTVLPAGMHNVNEVKLHNLRTWCHTLKHVNFFWLWTSKYIYIEQYLTSRRFTSCLINSYTDYIKYFVETGHSIKLILKCGKLKSFMNIHV